jgi:hypothetical protein
LFDLLFASVDSFLGLIRRLRHPFLMPERGLPVVPGTLPESGLHRQLRHSARSVETLTSSIAIVDRHDGQPLHQRLLSQSSPDPVEVLRPFSPHPQ